jgi:hypothetical protein
LILIGVPEDKAVLLNPEALPVLELAVLLVLGELAVLLVLDELATLLVLDDPQPVSTAAAITATATKLAVDARAPRGALRRGISRSDQDSQTSRQNARDAHAQRPVRIYPCPSTHLSPPRERRLARRRCRRLIAPIEIRK